MEHCALQVFPGPHAFLLVTDNRKETGKGLNTVTEVFGEEALAYVVVVIIGRTKPTGIRTVNKCEISFLEDNEESVQDLFRLIEIMTRNKESAFFVLSSYKTAFLLWDKEKHAEFRRETEKLLKEKEEQHDKEVTELKEKHRKHRKDMEDQHAKYIKEVEVAKENLKRDRESSKSVMIDLIRLTKDKHEVQAGVLSVHENQLIKALEAGSETNLGNIFPSIIDKLENKIKTSEETRSCLMDVFLHQENDREKEIEDLKEEVEKLKEKKSELEQKLREAEDRETQAFKQEETDRDLPTGLKKLEENIKENKEKTVTSGSEHDSSIESASPALFEEDKDRPLDEKAGEIKNKKQDSHNSGGFKLVRRGSIHEPPNMPEDQSGKQDSKARGKSMCES
ncbi:uncharacterized protein LOC143741166 [Siphateles boraxobius]|uniref:uncharacterized protein LOC143741166 n=1 Tax=Siphateles boraxobius TaxID=180520 RepID=UPI004062D311